MDKLSKHLWFQIQQPHSKYFFLSPGTKVKYSHLAEQIKKTSSWFSNLNIQRVMLCSDKSDVIAEITLAAIISGISISVVNSDIKQERLNSIASCFKPDLLILDKDSYVSHATAKVLIEKTGQSILNKLSFKKTTSPESYPACTYSFSANTLQCAKHDGPAYVIFTSGTTANPKGVCISRKSLFAHLKTISRLYGYNKRSRIYNSLDLSHADGLIQGPVLSAFNGIGWVSNGQFEMNTIEPSLDFMSIHEISHFITVPVVLALLEKYGSEDDVFSQKHFKTIVSTGGQLNTQLWKGIESKYQCNVSNLYGLTETCVGGVFSSPKKGHTEHGSIGKPVDMTFCLLSQGEVNENEGVLWLKGENVMDGYLDNDKATNSVLKDGWLNTGDIARQNVDGTLSIVGREKDLINAGGYAVAPEEIVETLCRLENVDNAFVTARHNLVYGEYIVAAVSSKAFNENAIISFLRDNLENHKVPKQVLSLEEFPLGRSGKIIKQQIEQLIDEQLKSQLNLDESENTLSVVLQTASNIFKLPLTALSMQSSTNNTPGWDSLNHLLLITALETQLNIHFSPQEIMSADSIARISELAAHKDAV